MTQTKHTPGPWEIRTGAGAGGRNTEIIVYKERPITKTMDFRVSLATLTGNVSDGDAALIAAAPDLLEALKEGRRAIGDHNAPSDCYATGPLTGDPMRDLVQCPGCSFIKMYDAAIAKAEGQS